MKRYDSYKDCEIQWSPQVPSHWKVEKIKHLFTEKRSTSNHNLNSGSISFGEVIYKDDESIPISTKESYQELLEGEFLINPLNLNYDLKSLRIGLSRINVVVSQGYIILINTSQNSSEFLRFLLREFDIRHIKSLGNGVRQTISFKHLSNELLPVPPLSEQQQIVSFLDTKTSLIDSLIEKTQRKIELLKEKRTSLINELVTKGLNPNVEMKDSGVEWIGEIPSHWGKIKLHTLVTSQKLEFQDGNHGGLHPIPEEFLEIGVPFIKPKDIQKEKVLWDSCDRLPFERCEQFRIGFSNNDDVLLVNRGGSIGKVVYVSDYDNEFPYFVINPQVTYLRGKNGLLSKYIFYISISDIFQCGLDLIMGHGSTFPFLGLSNMGDFEIVFPDISEQQQIVEYLDEQTQLIDKTIFIEEKKIELLKEYRQSLISEVVTGKIDVRLN